MAPPSSASSRAETLRNAFAWLLGSALIVSGLRTVIADESGQPEGNDIQAKVQELHSLRATLASESQSQEARITALEEGIKRLEREKDKVSGGLVRDRESLASKEQELDLAKTALEKHRTTIDRARRDALVLLAPSKVRISNGILYRREMRLKALEAIVLQLGVAGQEFESDGVKAALIALRAFWSRELSLMRSCERWNERVKVDEVRERFAYVVRLGLIHQSFLTEDRAIAGIFSAAQPSGWMTDLDKVSKAKVTQLVEVLGRRLSPRLVGVPVPAKKAAE